MDKLQELRINRGLSQRRLADLAGVSNTSVWKIEQGGGANPATLKKLADAAGIGKNTVNRLERDLTEPRPPTLRKLAEALGVDPADLVE